MKNSLCEVKTCERRPNVVRVKGYVMLFDCVACWATNHSFVVGILALNLEASLAWISGQASTQTRVLCPQSLQDKTFVTRSQWSFLSKFCLHSSCHIDILWHYIPLYGVTEGYVLRVCSSGDRPFANFLATNFDTEVKKLTYLPSSHERSQIYMYESPQVMQYQQIH